MARAMLSFTTCGMLLVSFMPCAWIGVACMARASPTAVERVEAANTYRFIVSPLVRWEAPGRDRDRKFGVHRLKVTGRMKFIFRDIIRIRCENFRHVFRPIQPQPGTEPSQGRVSRALRA